MSRLLLVVLLACTIASATRAPACSRLNERPIFIDISSTPSDFVTSAPNSTAINESNPSSGTGTVKSIESAETPMTCASCRASSSSPWPKSCGSFCWTAFPVPVVT